MKKLFSFIFPPIIIVIVSFIVSIKVVDLIIGYSILGVSNYAKIRLTTRSVNLKEISPNLNTVFKGKEGTLIKFRTNNEGFIIGPNDSTSENDKKKPNIIFLGGSTTECQMVQEHLRFPILIRELIKKKNGETIYTLNGGVSGSNMLLSSIKFMARIINYKPDLVILMHNINDFSQLIKTGSYWIGPETRKVIIDNKDITNKPTYVFFRSVKDLFFPNIFYLIINSKLIQTTQDKLSKKTFRDEFADFRNNSRVVDINEIQNSFRSSLNSFVEMSKAWNIEPVLMTQFNSMTIDNQLARQMFESTEKKIPYENYIKGYSDFQEIIRDVASNKNVHLIDLDKLVPKDMKYFHNAVHLNDEGSKLVAKIISESLQERYSNKFVLLEN